jgi:hypothetical protein
MIDPNDPILMDMPLVPQCSPVAASPSLAAVQTVPEARGRLVAPRKTRRADPRLARSKGLVVFETPTEARRRQVIDAILKAEPRHEIAERLGMSRNAVDIIAHRYLVKEPQIGAAEQRSQLLARLQDEERTWTLMRDNALSAKRAAGAELFAAAVDRNGKPVLDDLGRPLFVPVADLTATANEAQRHIDRNREQQRKLGGLDKPAVVEHTGAGGGPVQHAVTVLQITGDEFAEARRRVRAQYGLADDVVDVQ